MDTARFIKANYTYNEGEYLRIMREEYGFEVIKLGEEEYKKFSQWHLAGLREGVGSLPGGEKIVDTVEEWLKFYGKM